MALGACFEGQIDEHNSFSASLQFDKLLVPTPTYSKDNQGKISFVDANRNTIPDFKELGSIAGMLTSFGDHANGIGGELGEIITHIGGEYAYQKHISCALDSFTNLKALAVDNSSRLAWGLNTLLCN